MRFQEILSNHEPSQARKQSSQTKLALARESFLADETFSKQTDICVFAAGSLGRLDCGKSSDLDVFVTTSEKEVGRLEEIQLFASIMRINNSLQYPALSNDGQFLKIFHIPKSAEKIGSAADDVENYFTTRMLLILESNYLSQEAAYNAHKQTILKFYCRDDDGQKNFKPIFLLNDLLRYWRTLCLNYEQARTIPNKSWKKRNFNLKFSRLLSVFGTVLPLILLKDPTADRIEELCSHVPMERLAIGLDKLEDADELHDRFRKVLDSYEAFLDVKENQLFDEISTDVRLDLQTKADDVSEFIFDALNHKSVPKEYRRYLVM